MNENSNTSIIIYCFYKNNNKINTFVYSEYMIIIKYPSLYIYIYTYI